MAKTTKKFRQSKQSRIVLGLSILTAAFWYVTKIININEPKIVGVIVEILWLPMIIGLFALPIVSIGFWVRDKFNLKSLYLYSLLIGIAGLLVTMIM